MAYLEPGSWVARRRRWLKQAPIPRRHALLLTLLLAAHAIAGLLGPFVPSRYEPLRAALLGLAVGVLCYLWARADARARGQLPPGRAPLWAALVPVIGVPLYLFRTRPPRRALRDTAWAMAVAATALAFGWAGASVASAMQAVSA